MENSFFFFSFNSVLDLSGGFVPLSNIALSPQKQKIPWTWMEQGALAC